MANKLMPGTKAPELRLPLAGGGHFDLASQTPRAFTMVVFYRGYHCPVCKGFLATMNRLASRYEEAGFALLAASMDTEERAAKTKAEWDVANVPLGYGLTEATARDWGLWLSSSIKDTETKVFNEPGTFWIKPDGTLYLLEMSSMPFARPDLEFMLGKVPMVVENNYPARGTLAA